MQTPISYIKASLAVSYNPSSSCLACNACTLRRVRQSWVRQSRWQFTCSARAFTEAAVFWGICGAMRRLRFFVDDLCCPSDITDTVQRTCWYLAAVDSGPRPREPRPIPTLHSVWDLERDQLPNQHLVGWGSCRRIFSRQEHYIISLVRIHVLDMWSVVTKSKVQELKEHCHLSEN